MQDRVKSIKKQLIDHLEKENERGLRNLFDITHPSDLGSVLEGLEPDLAKQAYEKLPRERKVEVLTNLTPMRSVRLLSNFDDNEKVSILSELPPDDAADVFLTLEKEEQERLLSKIDDDQFRRTLIDLISYPADSAGGIMTTEYLTVEESITIQEAIDAARRRSQEAELIYYIYTVDEDNRISGVLSMRELLQTDPEREVREITNRDLVKVRVDDDQEKAAKIMENYGLLGVPVVDHQDRMRGIITVDDAVDILEQEATEDIYKQAGLSPYEQMETERNMRVTDSSFWTNMTIKVPWLVIVFVGTLVTASMVGMFEDILNKYVELAFFMPVIAAMGGNVGAQSTTIYVRALVLGSVNVDRFWGQFFTEIYRTGFGIGLFFGSILGLSAWLWQFMLRGNDPTGYALSFGIAVGASMFLAIIAASANGFLIPWIVERMGFDPATASNPLLTTIQDILGILIYFSCATFFLTYV